MPYSYEHFPQGNLSSDANHEVSLVSVPLGGGFKYVLFSPGKLGKMNPF